jgi:hypothetical protein
MKYSLSKNQNQALYEEDSFKNSNNDDSEKQSYKMSQSSKSSTDVKSYKSTPADRKQLENFDMIFLVTELCE